MPGERARVDALRARNVPVLQIFLERVFRAPATRDLAQLLDDKAARVRGAAFGIGGIGSVIADKRISHRDDLPAIGGIGQHFLIAGHRSVEANFAHTRAGRAKRFTLENPAIFECKNSAHVDMHFAWAAAKFKAEGGD